MGAGEESTCDPPPSSSSAAPPSPPPPLPAPPAPLPFASTKRRWSPCTWRYAIEEAQAELPSRSRSTIAVSGAPPSSSRSTLPPSQPQQQQAMKAKPPPHHNPFYGKAVEEAQRSSYVPSRYTTTESRMRSSSHSHPLTSSKSRITEPSKKSQHQPLSAKGRVSVKEEEEDDDAEQDEHDEDDDEGGGGGGGGRGELAHFDEEYFKRRRREMSPSELYFCPVCSASKGVDKGAIDSSYDQS